MSHTATSTSTSTLTTTDSNQTHQLVLFQQFKQFTVPLFRLVPLHLDQSPSISTISKTNQLTSILRSLSSLLDHHHHLLSPALCHYILLPLQHILLDNSIPALNDEPLELLLKLTINLVNLDHKLLDTLSEPVHLNLINAFPALLGLPDLNSSPSPNSRPRSDHSLSLAIDLLAILLRTNQHPAPTTATPPSLPPPSIRFLFHHLVPILASLELALSSSPPPSQSRALKTLALANASLTSLSHSTLPQPSSGLVLLSTLLPRTISQLTKLVTLLARLRGFSDALSTALHLIEWLLIECFDDDLPDIHDLLATDAAPSDQDRVPDVRAQVFQLASRHHSQSSPPALRESESPLPASPPPELELEPASSPLAKRDKPWLLLASTNIATVLGLLSASLSTHHNPAVHAAWLRLSTRLLARCSLVLRLSPGAPQTGFARVLDALLTARATGADAALISRSLAHAARVAPAAYSNQLTATLVGDLETLAQTLLAQTPGLETEIVRLATRLGAAIDALLLLTESQPSVCQTYLNAIDMAHLHKLFQSLLTRIRLAIPKLFVSCPSTGGFPRLTVTNICDGRCVDALEALVRKATQLVLLIAGDAGCSEIKFFGALLELATSDDGSGAPTNVQLNALWILGESLRAAAPLSKATNTPAGRARFGRLVAFGVDALQRLVEREQGSRRMQEGAEERGVERVEEAQVEVGYVRGNDRLFALERLRPMAQDTGALETAGRLGTCLVLRLAASLGMVLEEALQPSLSWLLYYVLAQHGTGCAYVRAHALAALDELAFRCGYGAPRNMVLDNADYVLNSVALRMVPNGYDLCAVGVLEDMVCRAGVEMLGFGGLEEVLLEDCCGLVDEYERSEVVCEQVFRLFRAVLGVLRREAEGRIEDGGGVQESCLSPEESGEEGGEKDGEDEMFGLEVEMARLRRALAGPCAGPAEDMASFEALQRARRRMGQVGCKMRSERERGRGQAPEGPFTEPTDTTAAEAQTGGEEEQEARQLTLHERLAAGMMDKAAYFLSHGSGRVRRSASGVLEDGVSLIGSQHESIVVPFVRRFWKAMVSRLKEQVGGGAGSGGGGDMMAMVGLVKVLGSKLWKFIGREIVEDLLPMVLKLMNSDGEDEDDDGYSKNCSSRFIIGLEILKEVLVSSPIQQQQEGESDGGGGGGGGGGYRLKESMVWEVGLCLVRRRRTNSSNSEKIVKIETREILLVEQVLQGLENSGFQDLVWLIKRGKNGQVQGMEFLCGSWW